MVQCLLIDLNDNLRSFPIHGPLLVCVGRDIFVIRSIERVICAFSITGTSWMSIGCYKTCRGTICGRIGNLTPMYKARCFAVHDVAKKDHATPKEAWWQNASPFYLGSFSRTRCTLAPMPHTTESRHRAEACPFRLKVCMVLKMTTCAITR
jgi:hypothetical protein